MITARAAARLRSGHVWVYRSDLKSEPKPAPVGGLVSVHDERSHFYGTALYSSSSQIAIRMLSSEALPAADFPSLVRRRVAEAIAYRRRVVRESDAFRVIFSEADSLPGLIVDRYGDLLTFQVLTQAMDSDAVREAVLQALTEELQPQAVLERVELRIRELEQLPAREGGVVYQRTAGEPKTNTIFTMNGIRFQFDALSGQKTGAFLDQRENYAAAEKYAKGGALDVFCYQGGFALHLARVCDQVTGVDSSRAALEVADQNAALNVDSFGGREIEWVEANAFDLLRDYSDSGKRYDTIVLDPPAFAKTKRNLETAMRGYKELNLRALKMVNPGGVFVTCSCSFHVGESEFREMLSAAAADAKRRLRILEVRGAALDHPHVLSIPETGYLKCVIGAVE